jgi:hypothetical protein
MRAGLSQVSASLLREIRKWAAGPTPDCDLAEGDAGSGRRTEAPLLVIEDFGETPWASLTFSGMRHRVDIRLEGEASALVSLEEGLAGWKAESAPVLAGHFLADLQIMRIGVVELDGARMSLSLRLDALTIEE